MSRPRFARIDDSLNSPVSDLTTQDGPVLNPSVSVLRTTIDDDDDDDDDDDNHVPMTTTTTMTSSAVIQPHPASCGGSQSPRHRQPLAEARGQVPLFVPHQQEALVGSSCPLELRKTQFDGAATCRCQIPACDRRPIIKAPEAPGSLERAPPLPVYSREPFQHSTPETELSPISKSTERTKTQAKTHISTKGTGTHAKPAV